jgi:hypothetical protein
MRFKDAARRSHCSLSFMVTSFLGTDVPGRFSTRARKDADHHTLGFQRVRIGRITDRTNDCMRNRGREFIAT